ncbi:replication initiator protein A, partial [Arsenophonus nasoniae]|uniref:replication initiator protein A n=1 Tax=Arsenophonus nasoniae TaxID=638 RepID=UPI003879DF7F
YQAITKTKVLQISPDYFRIRKAIDRRIYEIARKHCGNQHEFIISLEKIYLKTGSVLSIRLFKGVWGAVEE